MSEPLSGLKDLNDRSRDIFKHIVETYLETGAPVGSRNLSRQLPMTLSPASVRNVMADLEAMGLVYAPHASAGRMPTQVGLRMFVDCLLELGDLSAREREQIQRQMTREHASQGVDEVLSEASGMLSGLSRCAGLVVAEKQVTRIKHIEFVNLDTGRALLVLVGEDGAVENRIVTLPEGLPPSALVEAGNYLNARIRGLTLYEARDRINQELKEKRDLLDELTKGLIESGLAEWSGGREETKSLIVRGHAHLLEDLKAVDELERIRLLFEDLESKKEMIQLLDLADDAEGVRIFIGSENQLFSLSGSSVIVAPFRDSDRNIVGVLGVIGPTRLNYARVIPVVDYTAKLVGRLLT
ncbi:MAG: heat-inducible transcriptional repressor HrcA [Dichotomicrobium sp.]